MPDQKEAGKAFEFAILSTASNFLSRRTSTQIVENSSLKIAEASFNMFDSVSKEKYLKAAYSAFEHIVLLEPKLSSANDNNDVLELQLAPDNLGNKGDVRDVLFIKSKQNWEIGISAKNNHRAVKHSRLSDKLDFGTEWFGLNCNKSYFDYINPYFLELRKLKSEGKMWRELKNKADRFYLPILTGFKNELMLLNKQNSQSIPSKLLKYLIGGKDFYKVIKRNRKTEIYGFNFNGSLNKPTKHIRPQFKVAQLKLPKRIIELDFKVGSKDTLLLVCSEGWSVSFRIHNASSRIEPSLKFDINLVGQPPTLYSHHVSW